MRPRIHDRRPLASRLLAPLLALALAGCGSSPETPPAVLRVPVGTSPVSGPSDAWVTIVTFSDFQCPFCAQVQPTLATVLPEFGADVRLVFKHFPLSFHVRARPLAVAAVCAQAQGRFWAFHDLVFAEQSSLVGSQDFEAALASVATRSGLDLAAWQGCRVEPASSATVTADVAVGAGVGIGGTPTFVVNGVALVGAQPASAFRAAIGDARAKAVASGVPAAQYYDKVILGL